MVGEEMVGRNQCLVRVLEMGEAGQVGVEVSGAAPKAQSMTQRDLILEAVEARKALLGQGVGIQVVDLIQEHIPPSLLSHALRLS